MHLKMKFVSQQKQTFSHIFGGLILPNTGAFLGNEGLACR